MKKPIRILQLVIVCSVMGASWAVIANMVRIEGIGLTRPLTFYCLISAVVMAACVGIFERSYPRLSLKALHASVSLGTLYFFLPGVIVFLALRYLPPFVVAMVICATPLWFWIFRMGRGKARPIFHAMTIVGFVLFFLGTVAYDKITFYQCLLLLFVFIASLLMATGLAISKKILWIHSAIELNFWSLVFAAGSAYLLGWIFNDIWLAQPTEKKFWIFLILSSVMMAGSGYAYRYAAFMLSELEVLIATLTVPISAWLFTWIFFRPETALNFYSIIGVVTYLAALALASRTESAALWMSHALTNTRRQGDRVVCSIQGFMQKEKGALAKVEVIDLSIGGLGFKCNTMFAVGDTVTVSFPLGKSWTQVAIECKVVHVIKTPDPAQPWLGGVQFMRLEENTMQILVEFLAKIALVGEHV